MDFRNRVQTKDLHDHIGETVQLAGWVDARRDHGKLIFVDLRDATGKIQMVAKPDNEAAHEEANRVRGEWCISVSGLVKERPEKMVNSEQTNGDLEFEITELTVLTEAETPPFELDTSGYEVTEEIRLTYRYLDLRRARLAENIQMRSAVLSYLQRYLTDAGFFQVETPNLANSSPEGARDYVIPSRIDIGKFYALPQAPQQFKQMLMLSGLERYFQIARCFRDEDTRGDRQPEFTQLDIEMSFVDRDQVMALVEDMFTKLVKELYPSKRLTSEPWPRLTYREAMESYGTDRPDLRHDPNDPDELAFGWVIDFPLFEEERDRHGNFQPSHHMFTMPRADDMETFYSDPANARSTQMDLVLNGNEVGGGSIRIHDPDVQQQMFDLIGFSEEDVSHFKHMLTAFRYGAPPHGGIAPGLDRLMMVLQNEETIRETIAFPKTGEGRDLMMGAPSAITNEQLHELGLHIEKPRDDQQGK
jgi:aspartyl-tRNA synthetase